VIKGELIPALPTGYTIYQSLRFNDNDSAYLSRTPSSAGNRKTWTWSGWIKFSSTKIMQLMSAGANGTYRNVIEYDPNGTLGFWHLASGIRYKVITNALYRDYGSWYHVVFAIDTTQATPSDRVKIYVNGEHVTSLSTATYGNQNLDTYVNNNTLHALGRRNYSSSAYLDGYLAEVNFIDGYPTGVTQANWASTNIAAIFGETDEDYGHWKPKQVTGLTYGTNGFYLDFADSADLGNDVSGEGNDWTPTNLAATDVVLDTPTNNFATFNPIDFSGGVLSEGNLKQDSSGACNTNGTFSITNHNTYFEIYVINASGGVLGIGAGSAEVGTALADLAKIYGYSPNGNKYENSTGTAYGASYTAGDIIGVKYNSSTRQLEFLKNNVSQGVAFTVTDGFDYLPQIHLNNTDIVLNFGQDSSFAGNKTAQSNTDGRGRGDFYYSPPTGFNALCTANLPDPAVIPSEHFNIVTYSGTGSGHSITGVGFQPDFSWIKMKSWHDNHWLIDAVRGASKGLGSNLTSAENDDTSATSAFNSDGFAVGFRPIVNRSGKTFVAWNWKANGSGSSNTDGSITSTVSANTDAGISIFTYTGNSEAGGTIGHGLGKVPSLMILKNRDAVTNWLVYHEDVGATKFLALEETTAASTSSAVWNNTAPTSSVLTVGTSPTTSSHEWLGFAFAEIEGYSKIGSYTGNGSTDGPFVHCGFRPSWLLWKPNDAGKDWVMIDKDRNVYNVIDNYLLANSSAAEGTLDLIDFTSNGFKLRTASAGNNTSGTEVIFIAFAEYPFKYTNAR